jgi:hypothetical protein
MVYAGRYDLKPNSLKFTSSSRHQGNDCQALTGGFRARIQISFDPNTTLTNQLSYGLRVTRGNEPMSDVRPARQGDANRDFGSYQGIEWRLFLIMLVAFAIMDYLAGRG